MERFYLQKIERVFAASEEIKSFSLGHVLKFEPKLNDVSIPRAVMMGFKSLREEDKAWLLEMNLTAKEAKAVGAVMESLSFHLKFNHSRSFNREDYV